MEFSRSEDAIIIVGLTMVQTSWAQAGLVREAIGRGIMLFVLGWTGVLILTTFQAYRTTKARLISAKALSEKLKQEVETTRHLAAIGKLAGGVAHDLEKKSITATTDIQSSGSRFYTDPDRVNQILLNLYMNSLAAMEAGGTLTVTMIDVPTEEDLEIRVTDDGCGMDDQILSDMFDPYFTTRPDGTGLGLSIVHRLVESLGGEIRVKSTKGKGTTVSIYLRRSWKCWYWIMGAVPALFWTGQFLLGMLEPQKTPGTGDEHIQWKINHFFSGIFNFMRKTHTLFFSGRFHGISMLLNRWFFFMAKAVASAVKP